LSVENFLIHNGISKSIEKASKLANGDDHELPHQSLFSLKSGNDTFEVRSLKEILERSKTCSFCFLILRSVERPTASEVVNEDIGTTAELYSQAWRQSAMSTGRFTA